MVSSAKRSFADELRGAPSARSLLVGDRRSRITSRVGGSGGSLCPPHPPPGVRRVALLLLLSLVLLGATGCRLQLDVNVEVASAGSGVVEVVVGLDADAVDRIGGDAAVLVDAGELADAGWVVDGPTTDADGFTRLRIRQPFASPEEAAHVFAEIAVDEGPFRDFEVTRERSFAETRVAFTGNVDFAAGFGGGGLAAEVDGEPLGQSVEEIEAQLGDSLSRLIEVRVRARLPGAVTSNATTKADNGAVWQVGFGEGGVDLEAVGTQRRTTALVVVGIAVVGSLALLGLLLFRLAGRVVARDRPAAR